MAGADVGSQSPEVERGIPPTFGRRLGVVAAIVLGAQPVSYIAGYVLVMASVYGLLPIHNFPAQFGGRIFVVAIYLSLVFAFLRTVQHGIVLGERTMMDAMTEGRILGLLAILFIVAHVMPNMIVDHSLMDSTSGYVPAAMALNGLAGVLLSVFTCVLWIWWCNGEPRAQRLVAVSALSWMGFDILLNVARMSTPSILLIAGNAAPPEAIQIPLAGTEMILHTQLSPPLLSHGLQFLSSSMSPWYFVDVFSAPVAAGIGVLVYFGLNRGRG